MCFGPIIGFKMEESLDIDSKQGNSPVNVKFDYIKSNFFRVVHADGVMSSMTPRGQLHLSIWTERNPIPRQVVHAVDEENFLGPEISRISRDAVIREVEVGVTLDISMAKALVNALNQVIQTVDSAPQNFQEKVEVDQV